MPLKIGIIGLRGIGNLHADCHMKDPLAKLVAVCDVIKDRADKTAAKHGVKAYYSLKDMMDGEPDLDIIDVATGGYENGSWHFEPAMEAMEAGKHVLVEKPLSNSVLEARQMVAKAAEKKVYLGCNLNHYFTPPAEKAMEYIKQGMVGEQLFCLHKMGFAGGEATYGPQTSTRVMGHQYFHVKAFLTHPFSVMRHFCGDISHVQAFFERPSFRKKHDDLMISVNGISVKFVNGAIGYLLSQRGDSAFGLGGWWSLEVGGTKGTFVIENCIEKLTYWPAPVPANAAKPEAMSMGTSGGPQVFDSGIKDFNETFPRRLHGFLEDITAKVPLEKLRASGRDALAALEYTWAAMESYEQGGILVRPHPLPLLKGDPTTELD
jgi:predicted dehydrogenase